MISKTCSIVQCTAAAAAALILASGCSSSPSTTHNTAASGGPHSSSNRPTTTQITTPPPTVKSTSRSSTGTAETPTTTPTNAQRSTTPKYGPPQEPTATLSPIATANPANQAAVLNSLPGSTKQNSCQVVGDQRDVRSGTIAAGNFAVARQQYSKLASPSHRTAQVFLYIIPQRASSMSGVTLRMTPLSGSGKSTVTTVKTVDTANDWRYYSAELNVPGPGKWRLSAASGPNAGCFDVTFSI